MGKAPSPEFAGITYEPERDKARLSSQLEAVREAMKDGEWHTLEELSERCGGTVSSVSARLRDLRKPKFGGYLVEREHVVQGLFHYRMILGADGKQGRAAERFSPEDRKAALEALRAAYPHIPVRLRVALIPLGRWLARNL